MFYNYMDQMKKDLVKQKEMKNIYEKQLKGLNVKGSLSCKIVNGHTYYTVYNEGTKRYIKKRDFDEVILLKEKHVFSQSLNIINKNIELMEDFISQYQRVDPNILRSSLAKAYKTIPQTCYDAAGAINVATWMQSPYEHYQEYPEGLMHKTVPGYMVRSRAEMNIANIYHHRRIPVRYEEVLRFKDGQSEAPDFTVLVVSENRIKWHEHCGLMGKEKYAIDFDRKMSSYINHGLIPMVDVIYTFDGIDGSFNSSYINDVISLFLL